jgi:single-strand DNA-binding protein
MKTLRNRVQLIGNLGADPELIEFESGSKKASFSLATTESYKNQSGEKVTETQWHRVILWGGQATVAEKYLQKGREVAIQGKLITREYEDKTGQKRYITEVVADELLLLGRKV